MVGEHRSYILFKIVLLMLLLFRQQYLYLFSFRTNLLEEMI